MAFFSRLWQRIRLWTLSLLILGALLAVLLVLLELALRWQALRSSPEARDFAQQSPYLTARMKPDAEGVLWGIPFRTNRYGFRDEEDFPQQPPPGEARILSLGDSIGFGLGIPSTSHYTQVLEAKLNHSGEPPIYRVINAGAVGDSPSAYAVYLRHEGLRLKPELVLAEIELCNDVSDEALIELVRDAAGRPHSISGGRYIIAWDGNYLSTAAAGPYFFEKTYTYSLLLRGVLNLLQNANPRGVFEDGQPGVTYYSLGFDRYLLTQERIESGWQQMFGALENIRQMAQQNEADFLLLIVPSRHVFQDRSNAFGKFAEGLVERAVRMAQERSLPYLDLRQALQRDGAEKLYLDLYHLNEQGNRVIGETIAKAPGISP